MKTEFSAFIAFKPALAPKDYKMLLVSLKVKPDDLDYLIETGYCKHNSKLVKRSIKV
jgi:hypothetical protein